MYMASNLTEINFTRKDFERDLSAAQWNNNIERSNIFLAKIRL